MYEERMEQTCEALKHSLGPFGFLWLCACAVYPGLRFPLTTALGTRLAQAVGRKPPDEDEHLALFRLPWFRTGWMPEELRLALLRRLDPGLHQLVRTAIEDLLVNSQPAAGSDARPGAPPGAMAGLDVVRPARGWSGRLRLWLAAPAAGPEQDAIFVHYMIGKVPGPADLALNRALSRLFGTRLAGWLDRPTLMAALAATGAGLLAWATTDSLLLPAMRGSTVLAERPIPQMVALPAGEFWMGSPDDEPEREKDESPRHRVKIAAFAIGKYEVTFAEWDACVDDGGCNGYRPSDEGWDTDRDRRPVINVSWNHAKAYVTWLTARTGQSYRLPSEAEWEYAARAGTVTRYWWGNDPGHDRQCEFANGADAAAKEKYKDRTTVAACRDGHTETAPVGSFRANPFGLQDMAGNVWEWIEDCWHESYAGAPSNEQVWMTDNCEYRVARGGSWFSNPRNLRAAYRDYFAPEFRNFALGFRVARTISP